MNITIGRGNNRRTAEILSGRMPTKAKRIEVERNSEQLKSFLFRPQLLAEQ